ncbi:hypothetical protein MTBPR1_20148 [Candidatus Terasakiella magnetica]|uniref:SGNH hydrolase-type esterase domain-containing protein n=1 Tax=Candidatus Terasakiella magnetica TaxID=1867952 RepID=A0A1C3RG87_9PROT|nr:SGNH/GDSL hydrolase family protein [Candidatus Terasakiella magnetica]SCA56300.1 hypothetical protein MTBPR1_20148 [Candidatus Terasakiella magnetica]
MNNDKNWFELNPKKTISSLFLIFIFICILLIEMTLSITKNHTIENGQKRYIRLKELNINYQNTIIPDIEYMKTTDSLVRKPYIINVDNNGFIKPSKVHDEADKTIVFIGGSTTECLYVDEFKRFPYLVGKNLEEEFKLKINSFNSGVSGNNSLHSIDILINKIIPMQPDIIVLMHNINELSTLIHEGSYWNNNSNRSPLITLEEPKISYLLLKSIKDYLIPNFYTEIKKIIHRFKHSNKQIDEFYKSRNKININKEKILIDYKRNLEIFIHISKLSGIQPILMTQFNRFKEKPTSLLMKKMKTRIENKLNINYSDFIELYKKINHITIKVAQKNNIYYIDLDKLIPKESKYIYDSVHLNTFGSTYTSKIISASLIKMGLFNYRPLSQK